MLRNQGYLSAGGQSDRLSSMEVLLFQAAYQTHCKKARDPQYERITRVLIPSLGEKYLRNWFTFCPNMVKPENANENDITKMEHDIGQREKKESSLRAQCQSYREAHLSRSRPGYVKSNKH